MRNMQGVARKPEKTSYRTTRWTRHSPQETGAEYKSKSFPLTSPLGKGSRSQTRVAWSILMLMNDLCQRKESQDPSTRRPVQAHQSERPQMKRTLILSSLSSMGLQCSPKLNQMSDFQGTIYRTYQHSTSR